MAMFAPHRRRKRIPRSRLFFPRLCWMILFLTTFAATSEQCAVLSFPDLPPSHRVTAREHSTVDFRFVVDMTHCPEQQKDQRFFIYVSQDSPQNRDTADFCVLRMTDGRCSPFNNASCPCKDGGIIEARFIKTVTRADNGIWIWRSGDGRLKTAVTFNIQGAQDSSSEDKDLTPDPELKLSSSNSDQPQLQSHTTPKGSPGNTNLSPPTANGGREKNKNKVIKDQSTALEEREKREEDEKKRSGDDDDKDEDGSVPTSVIVGMVNVITIIVVVVVVFVLVRRHSRKVKRHPRDSMPPLPNDARLPGQRPEVPCDVINKCNTIASVASSHYEVLSMPESPVIDNDGYLQPAATGNDVIQEEDIDVL